MNAKPRVYLFEETEFPITGCSIYGDVQYICPKAVARPAVMQTNELTDMILQFLTDNNYDKDKDYFVVVGGLQTNTIAVAAIANEFGQFNALLYDRHNRSYTSRRLG